MPAPTQDECPQPWRACPLDNHQIVKRMAVLENEAAHINTNVTAVVGDIKEIRLLLSTIDKDFRSALDKLAGVRWSFITILAVTPVIYAAASTVFKFIGVNFP